MLRTGDFRAAVVEQAIAQEFLGECSMVLFVTMILQRMRPRYQDRSYRYGLLEQVTSAPERRALGATAMGLGACGVGAFMDDAINDMLGVDGVDEAAVYMMAVGHRRDVAAHAIRTMLDFLRRDQPGFAAVHFAGTVAAGRRLRAVA